MWLLQVQQGTQFVEQVLSSSLALKWNIGNRLHPPSLWRGYPSWEVTAGSILLLAKVVEPAVTPKDNAKATITV